MTLSPKEESELRQVAAENLQLREEVKRRTAELEHKNRELEIEAALEHVRAIAMSMQEPHGMLDICKMISDQLGLLGVKEIRNVQTAIIYPSKGTYLNFEYYTKHNRSFVTEVHYDNHQMSIDFVQQMLKDPDGFFTHSLNGDELSTWYAFQKTTNQFVDDFLATSDSLNYYWHSAGPVALGISTYFPLRSQEIELFKRFRNVFGLAYRRYLDIENALSQAREVRIELALERVRARTMAMQRSEEMVEASHVLFIELHALGIEAIRTGVATVDAEHETVTVWSSQLVEKDDNKILGVVPRKAHAFFDGYYDAWKKKEPYFTYSLSGDEVRSYYTTMSSILSYPLQSEFNSKETFQVFFFPEGSLNVILHEPLSEESCQLLIRFARVFGLIYRRFLDLKQAEAQTREARIEAALEKVRAVAMSMHTSDDLLNVCEVLFHELGHLGFTNIRNAIIDIYDDEKKWKLNYDYSDVMGKTVSHVPYDIHPFIEKQIKEIRKSEDAFSETIFTGQELEGWKEFRRKSGQQDDPRVTSLSTLHYYFFSISKGSIGISTFGNIDANQLELLKRFRNVFSLSYQRYMDIVLAETQARDARIEAALERVRARSLGMHKSDELLEVIHVISDQLLQLEIKFQFVSFGINNQDLAFDFWLASPGFVYAERMHVPYLDNPIPNTVIEAKKNGLSFFSNLFTKEENRPWLQLVLDSNKTEQISGTTREFLLNSAGFARSAVLLKSIYVFLGNYIPKPYTDQENEILIRFANVFEQSYTRFLDLQKAEAQAREAQIESSLERIRSHAMAMRTSDDLSETVKVYFKELKSLGMILLRCGVAEYGDEPYLANITVTSATSLGDSFQVLGRVKQIGHPVLEGIYEHWVRQEEFFPVLQGKDLHAYNQVVSSKIDLPDLPEETTEYGYYFYFKEGSFFIWAQEKLSEDAVKLFRRFTSVLSLTYRRYLDLVEAEAQTRKAHIETALEKVRARALAMQQPEELMEVAEVMRSEMGLLGVEELETCSIYIIGVSPEKAECWFAIKDVREEEKKLLSDHFTLDLNDTWVGREMLNYYQSQEKQISIVMTGTHRKEWIHYCEEKSVPFQGYYGEVIPDRTYHLYKFSDGAIGAATPGDISDESWELLKRAASVFSLAYSRFKDLKQARFDLHQLKTEKARAEDALVELKAAQAQLIQSEKMASLGELTAGIAHEIQNPLNFVNNFSEVNAELIDELNHELATGNVQLAKEIAGNIKDNEQKINHHGKRADAIVKSMLQHSRSSSNKKEPTDINALADEYLRLAYHGLRAKDKSFNATIKTEFDESIGLINVVPQDIGRVILNLITNAFYAVGSSPAPQPPKGGVHIDPTVTVSTKRKSPRLVSGVEPLGDLGAGVEIRVKDNGPGIPDSIKDKIFQPFFTTKPTGQGTGLGLSLSYDIIKAHGGELKVETKEGEGTEFIIHLPLN